MPPMSPQDDMILTLVGLVVTGALSAFCLYRGTRPHEELKPRMIPWMFIACGSFATCVMVFVHLVNLLGWETGGGLPGR